MFMEPFKADLEKMHARAREKLTDGAVTAGYGADREQVLKVLNAVLATEIVCVLRYRSHYFMASGINNKPVATEFLEHATEELAHADMVAQRITQLGGVPNLDPNGLATRSHAGYGEGKTLRDMIQEDLIAERVAVQLYGEIVSWLGSHDPTSRRLMETLLATEEEHADDLATLLEELGD
jgi:bacterioferritin